MYLYKNVFSISFFAPFHFIISPFGGEGGILDNKNSWMNMK